MQSLKKYVSYLPAYGCFATGLIYLGIGVIAILSYLRLKDGGADEKSLFAFLNRYIVGEIVVWVILLGCLSYILWRIFEAIRDPYNYGSNAMGYLRRIGIALSSMADAVIAYSAAQVLMAPGQLDDDGQPHQYRTMVAAALDKDAGQAIIIIVGVFVLLTALVQLYYGTTKGYRERLDIKNFSVPARNTTFLLAYAGYIARAIIIGISGFFLTKAGIVHDAQFVVNTDKAFDFIGDHIGGIFFIIVAAGTICYAFFMFVLGVTYDPDKD